MRVLFEEFPYANTKEVSDTLAGIVPSTMLDRKSVKVNKVGYFYNPKLNEGKGDMVFILPKVFLRPKDEDNQKGIITGDATVLGLSPVDFVNITSWDKDKQSRIENHGALDTKSKVADFIYGFSIWIYRAIDTYEKRKNVARMQSGDEDLDNDEDAIEKSSIRIGHSRSRISNTLMDILLSLQTYNKQSQPFITYTIKNLHKGFNKINWTRTISKCTPIIQDGTPIYLNPVNKNKSINFDEELLVIYFSILNYMNEEFRFNEHIPYHYDLIKGKRFEAYLSGLGRIRLLKIKYKYFNDKAVRMWELCYAFFDKTRSIRANVNQKEYLLVNKFETIFEDMIDALIGDDNLPNGLKKQGDDKRIDHIYTYNDLVENNDSREMYYVGDSKYYPMGKGASGHDAPKQYTYARNIIQWHFDLMHDVLEEAGKDWKEKTEKYRGLPLFDKLTEGYNIIPNFFISGIADDDLSYKETGLKLAKRVDEKNNEIDDLQYQWQFKNRLFDRSSLFLSHYDINFLFVLRMYARMKPVEINGFKTFARSKFRDEIIQLLDKRFSLYQILLPNDEVENFVKVNFYELCGRCFSFKQNENTILLYAERKRQENEEYDDIENRVANNKLILANGKVVVEVEPVEFGKDIEKHIGTSPAKPVKSPEENEQTPVLHINHEHIEQQYSIAAENRNDGISEDDVVSHDITTLDESELPVRDTDFVLIGRYSSEEQLTWIKEHGYPIRQELDNEFCEKIGDREIAYVLCYDTNDSSNICIRKVSKTKTLAAATLNSWGCPIPKLSGMYKTYITNKRESSVQRIDNFDSFMMSHLHVLFAQEEFIATIGEICEMLEVTLKEFVDSFSTAE